MNKLNINNSIIYFTSSERSFAIRPINDEHRALPSIDAFQVVQLKMMKSNFLFYTGNKWTGPNQDKDLKQVQCLAVSEDGIHFEKIEDNPVITSAPSGDIHPSHFRDPKA